MAGPTMNAPPTAGGQGGDIAAQLMQLVQPLMNSPKGQAMAQALMAQMSDGADPRAAMAGGMPQQPQQAMPMGDMAGPATDSDILDMEQTNQDMSRGPQRRGDPYANPDMEPMPAPEGGMSTEDELAMAQQMMGAGGEGQAAGGHDGMNDDGPTPEEIAMLQSKPTPQNMQNFNKLFGTGAAEAILQGDTPSMDAADEGDHEYR